MGFGERAAARFVCAAGDIDESLVKGSSILSFDEVMQTLGRLFFCITPKGESRLKSRDDECYGDSSQVDYS